MFEKRYLEQVRILLNIIPLLNQYKEFAIKGGTAINFFLFNAPRLSVRITNLKESCISKIAAPASDRRMGKSEWSMEVMGIIF